MRKFCFPVALAVAIGFIPAANANLVINELMQSNIDCIMDDLNEFPDSWVELYNAGSQTEYLSSYKLGGSEKLKKAYKLPSKQIAPGEYVLIYCDKEGEGLHASFRLESGKDCAVFLFKDDEVVDKIEGMKKQPAPNIAYGRKTDASDEWGYQAIPTPGAQNSGSTCKDILGDPVFSEPGKVFTGSFNLTLSLPDGAPDGTLIRYTLDGKEPIAQSAVFAGSSIRISGSTVVRAKLFCDGYLSPRSLTHSYINHGRNVTLPVVSMVTDQAYFYDNKIGIYVQGTYKSGTPNYEYDWRRPINYEYFEGPDAPSLINQLCETRVKGGASRGNSLKSLAIYANKRFGEKRFNYEFFPDQTPDIAEFKSFEMRNSGNDFDYMYMRDAVIQQSMGMNSDLDWQPSRPVIFYLNGVYKGILNVRPRSNEDYIYSYYGGLEDIDMFENWNELKEGSWDNYNAFKEFYSGSGHSFEEFAAWMDVEEFCNLMIMGVFYDNKDFPGNNIVMWRPIAEGGKWRWIAKDTDFGMGLYSERYNYPTLTWVTTPGYDNNRNDWANSADATRLFRRLLDTPQFKDMFIDRTAVYLGDFLKAENIISLIDRRYNELKLEYKFHRDLFNPWWPNYEQEIESARRWTRNRCNFFYTHLASHFNLASPVSLTVNSLDSKLSINEVPLVSENFNGKFFPGRHLKVEATPNSNGKYVVGWNVKVTVGSNTQSATYYTLVLEIEMPQASKVEISPVLADNPDAVGSISAESVGSTGIYDLSGRSLGNVDTSSLTQGIYIVRSGSSSRKLIVK